jgi:hypothetical protein
MIEKHADGTGERIRGSFLSQTHTLRQDGAASRDSATCSHTGARHAGPEVGEGFRSQDSNFRAIVISRGSAAWIIWAKFAAPITCVAV